jgi:AraC family transcriptional regulator
MTEKTSAEMLERHIAGRLIAGVSARAPGDVIVQIFSRRAVQDSFIVPAVAEPLVVWILTGEATIEERDLGGAWISNDVKAGDFFVADSDEPYEMRWQSRSGQPFEVMHLYLGLPMLERAAAELFCATGRPALREVSGVPDPELEVLIGTLRRELTGSQEASTLLIEGVAQAIAVHLVREYHDADRKGVHRRSAIPAFKLRRVTDLMQADLAKEFNLGRYADVADLSQAHFSRQFKRSTGLAPSQYFIRMRMAVARQLLRETDRSIIAIGMDVGYSSPGHFSQVFRKETGVSPSDYRGG